MLTACKLMFCPTCCVFSPESIKNRSDIFYPVPERSCVPDSPVWYSTMPITLDVMTKMLTRILLVREIQEAHLHAQPIYVWWVGDMGPRAMGPRLCHDAANYIQLWHALWTLVTNACDNVYGHEAFLPCWWNGPWHFVKRGGYWTSYSVDCRSHDFSVSYQWIHWFRKEWHCGGDQNNMQGVWSMFLLSFSLRCALCSKLWSTFSC